MEQIEQYKVLSKQSELDPKDRIMVEMHAWCERQGDIVVLNSGLVLASDLASRSVQNCKILMRNKALQFTQVAHASQELIALLLANKEEQEHLVTADPNDVSLQQQRLRMLVREAVQSQASDIHIEVRQDIAKVKFRKHGELYLHAEWVPKIGRELAAVAFNKETDHSISHFNPLVPQGASMPMHIDGKEVRLRLASMPAHTGFDLVMRVLSIGDDTVMNLGELGYFPEQVELIKKALNSPHGAVLIAGPTGSGKTTTLASCMPLISEKRKVYSIEDPVEKIIRNATQIPINTEKEDRDFANMGRASLRMDPDVIVLGEMRDESTAKVVVRAAITGHLVFSTVHTNSAANIITRLVDMGISANLLGDKNLLVLLLFQRLVPKLCQRCAEPFSYDKCNAAEVARWQSVFNPQTLSVMKLRGKGCAFCENTGVIGRTVIAELIWIDESSRLFIQTSDTIGWEKYLRTRGWQSYREHCIRLIEEGTVDPYTAETVIGEITSLEVVESFNYSSLISP